MKQDWSHKKLTDLCAIQYGFAFDSSYFNDSGDGLPLIRIRDVVRGFSETYYRGAYLPEYIVKKGDYLIGMDGEFNIAQWKCGEALLNQRVCKISSKSDSYIEQFAYYFLCRILKEIEDETPFVTVKHLSAKRLNQILTPVPSIEEQKAICSLLDKMNRVIEAKKEQLKELDNLAQAIFYDMFGDPVTNEKGWEVKKLCEVSTLLNGRAYKQDELLNEGKYKVLRVGNFFTNGDYYYSNLELDDDKYCDRGDLLFAWSASFGAFIWGGSKVIYHYHIWKVLYDESKLNKLYYQYLLNKMTQSFMKDVHGIGMVHLTKAGMEQYIIPIPPLPLQQAFAEKVEAIERQKELINQSLREVQTLFDSRMDYWFSEEDDDFGQLDKLD